MVFTVMKNCSVLLTLEVKLTSFGKVRKYIYLLTLLLQVHRSFMEFRVASTLRFFSSSFRL